jgi:hypothetical protein
MRTGSFFVVIILMWLKGCVESDAQQGDPHARRLLEETSATVAAARDYGAEAGKDAARGMAEGAARVAARADAATSAAVSFASHKAAEARGSLAEMRRRTADFATSAGLAAGDLTDAGTRAAGKIRDAWGRARSRFD